MTISFERELAWAGLQMPRLRRALGELPDLTGLRLACSAHLDIKMVPLIEGLLERGASIFLTTCHPATVRDEVVEHLRRRGAQAEAWHNMPEPALQLALERALDWGPTHLCEIGADLSLAYHRRGGDLPPLVASLEATGSGIQRLSTLALRYPVYNWDDVPIKERLHNRHMVGLTTWHTFFSCTHLTLHEKRVLVVGYGLVGQGVAAAARAYGGVVSVAERDPARQAEAAYAGWAVEELGEALPKTDVLVTATGAPGVIGAAQLARLKDGAFLLNVGHASTEIDVAALRAHPHREVLPQLEAFSLDGRTVYLLAGGALANLTAGWGDSLNAFDITIALLACGLGYIVGAGAKAPPGLYVLPRHVWERVLPAVEPGP